MKLKKLTDKKKDDYHCIALQILDYLYLCLKNGEKPETDYWCSPLSDILKDLPDSYCDYIISNLHQQGYIEEVYPETLNKQSLEEKMFMGKYLTIYSTITPKGIDYLCRKKHKRNQISDVAEALQQLDAHVLE